MTTTEVSWDEERQRELDSTLACLTRLADYDVGFQWENEIDGVNHPLWTGRAQLPGVEEGSDEWRQIAQQRYWWQAIREEHGLTIREAAAELGVATSTLARWENSERTPTDASRPRYQHWLTDKKADLVDWYKNRIIDLVAERDGWPEPPSGAERQALLDEFSRVGGWWDQWRRTNSVPTTRR